jgi:hypothetical protein
MVAFNEKDRVDAVGREQRVIAVAQDGADIGQVLLLDTIADVTEIGRVAEP